MGKNPRCCKISSLVFSIAILWILDIFTEPRGFIALIYDKLVIFHHKIAYQSWLWFGKVPEPWKVQWSSCHLIHVNHDCESVFSRTACNIQIHTKCTFSRLEKTCAIRIEEAAGNINVIDGRWSRFILVITLRCWWPILT